MASRPSCVELVITSYSIHYTKLYEALPAAQLFITAAVNGNSEGLPDALRRAHTVFDDSEQATILERSVKEADPANAALAITELGPGLSHRPEIEQLLFDLLGDAQLGASASLVLQQSADPLVEARLDALAASNQGLAARRAALARDLRRGEQEAGAELQR